MKNKNNMGNSFVSAVKTNMGILVGLVILCIALTCMTDKFATTTNFFNVVRQITINLYLACGMTFIILLGGIDLSVGSIIAVAGCVSAGMITWQGMPVYAGIAIGILCGMVWGIFNGLIVSKTTIPAFIVTLATMNVGRGFARIYTHAQTISVLNDEYIFWGMGTVFGVPIQLFVSIAIIIVSSFILNKTKLGRHIYAVGGNKQAAEYSGIHVQKVVFFVFLYSGLLAALAGILTVGRTFTATMIMGEGAEMDAIAAVVLGGTSMSGGKGTISGTVIGVIVIGVLKNGMNLLGIDSSWQYVVQGAVILLAVYIDYLKQEGGSISFLQYLSRLTNRA